MVLKLLKVLAEKPQYKPLSNARNVSTDATCRILPKNFAFQPKVTVLCLCSACAGHTGPHMFTWAWRIGLSLEIQMQALLQKPSGKQLTYMQHDTGSNEGGASKTWVLTARRSLPLAAEALDMLQKMWSVYTVREVTIQQN